MSTIVQTSLHLWGSVSLVIAAAAMTGALLRSGLLREQALDGGPKREGALSLFDVVIALMLMVLGPTMALAIAGRGLSGGGQSFRAILLSHAGWLPLIGYILVRARMTMRGGVWAFGLGLRDRRRTGWTMLAGVGVMLILALGAMQLTYLLTLAIGHKPPEMAHPTLRALAEGRIGPTEIALIVSAVLVAPVFEEIMFRGLCQTALAHSGAFARRWSVIAASALLFTLFHGSAVVVRSADGGVEQFAWQALVVLMVLALCLGYVYERTGSLWPSIVLHVVFNAANIAVVIWLAAAAGT